MARALLVVFLLVAVAALCTSMAVEAAPLRADAKADLNSHRKTFGDIARSISDKIKHIVVLMMENRSFDHMFGFYGKGTNGLTGKEYNLLDINNPGSKKIFVNNKAPYINKCDPVHDTFRTTAKLYGNHSRAEACNFSCVDMQAFVSVESQLGKGKAGNDYCNVMQALNNAPREEGGTLPVLTALADEYVLMDRFFCSMPGATWPNRLFHLAATAGGVTETFPWYEDEPGNLFPQKTILDQVDDVGGQWKIYYNDTPWEMFMESVAHNPENLQSMTRFFEDCKKGQLPDYSFINPRSGVNLTERVGSNDHHPDHDIRAGEQYYKDIYEAIRASPNWNETLFIITYDEHGGFYDHVPPPTNVPMPDDHRNYPDPNFRYDRLGVRIPTLLISPWVPKGLVVGRAPETQRPFANSEYDLTSIMASARKILKKLEGVPPLTKRDAWASTFEHVLEILPEVRTDCPMHLPDPEPPTKWDLSDEARQPINHLQSEIMAVHRSLADPFDASVDHPHHIQRQSQIGEYVESAFAIHKDRTLRWKAGKGMLGKNIRSRNADGARFRNRLVAPDTTGALNASYSVRINPYKSPAFINKWVVNVSKSTPRMVIHGKEAAVQNVCLSVTELAVGSPITINLCYPSNSPTKNRDPDQWWIVGDDTTIRPFKAQHLCVTNDFFQAKVRNQSRVYLDNCKDSVTQHYSYHGKAPGDAGSGVFYYGDGATVIAALLNEKV